MMLYKQPFLLYFISLTIGVIFQEFLVLSPVVIWIFLSIASFFCAGIFTSIIYFHRFRSIPIMALFIGLGLLLHQLNQEMPLQKINQKQLDAVFIIDKKLNNREKTKSYVAEVFHHNEKIRCGLTTPKNLPDLDYQHYYKAKLWINKTESPTHDFQFDYAKYLARDHIMYQAHLPDTIYSAHKKKLNFSEKIKDNRLWLLNKLDQSSLQKTTKNFMKGIILADRTEMDKLTSQDFNKTGLTHFLAISGAHMVIINWLLMQIFTLLLPRNRKKIAIITSLVFLWIFSAYIGFGSSVMRSILMITIYYVYIILQRKPDLLHALSMAGLLIVVWDTQQVFNIGFQLSFSAVLGIYYFNPVILAKFPIVTSKFWKFLLEIGVMTISAQLSTLPIVLYYFHQFSWISLPANFVIVPLSEFFIVFSLVMVFLLGIGINIGWLNIIYDYCVQYLLKLIHWFADFDFLYNTLIPFDFVEVIGSYVLIFLLWKLLMKSDVKNVSILILGISCFISLRMILGIQHQKGNEIVVANYFKEKIILIKNDTKVTVITSMNIEDDKIINAVINPYCTSRRIKNFKIRKTNSPFVKINDKVYNLGKSE